MDGHSIVTANGGGKASRRFARRRKRQEPFNAVITD
jgi:hypothetical protein